MVDELPSMIVKAIGTVRNSIKQAPGHYKWQDVVSEIIIDNSLSEALDNLDEFSHIIVLYWMHQVDSTTPPATRVHPCGDKGLPLMGLFATRSPRRPNPIGKATVRLLQRQGNVLKVKGLDAIDGTPVIDIKPYIPSYDSAADATVPSYRSTTDTKMPLWPENQ